MNNAVNQIGRQPASLWGAINSITIFFATAWGVTREYALKLFTYWQTLTPTTQYIVGGVSVTLLLYILYNIFKQLDKIPDKEERLELTDKITKSSDNWAFAVAIIGVGYILSQFPSF